MKSKADVRYNGTKSFRSTNLIFHQGITNILDQVIDPLCILRDVEELGKVPSGHQCVHGMTSHSQFPGGSIH